MNQRIGILGDVHAEDLRLKAALSFFEKSRVDLVICTGDISDGCGDINLSCRLLAENSVLCVAGNHDRWLLSDKVRSIPLAHKKSDLDIESLCFLEELASQEKIVTPIGELILCHGVLDNDLGKIWPGTEGTKIERAEPLDELLESFPPRLLINGHVHYRTIIDFNYCQVLNAGTLRGDYPAVTIIDCAAGQVDGYVISGGLSVELKRSVSLFDREYRRVWRNTQEFDGNWIPATLN